MSAKTSSAAAFVALILALGALGYAGWATWTLREGMSRLAQTQERNMKEMMISLAHTEGQLGRVKEAMNAFDLQQWLATVEGPLVDGLEEKLVDVQRGVVRQEVGKWAERIQAEQTKRMKESAEVLREIKKGMVQQAAALNRVSESLEAMEREQEARSETLSQKLEEGIGAELVALHQENEEIKARLDEPDAPSAELRAELEGVRKENRELRDWLEKRNAAEEEFRTYVTESLDLFAEAVQEQNARVQERLAESAKRWQGLFLTLRENHEAELQSIREAVRQLEEERAVALEQLERERVERAEAERERQERARESTGSEPRGGRMSELIEFCSRRPESVLCRDLEVR